MARFRRLARDDERLPETLAGWHVLSFAVRAVSAVEPRAVSAVEPRAVSAVEPLMLKRYAEQVEARCAEHAEARFIPFMVEST